LLPTNSLESNKPLELPLTQLLEEIHLPILKGIDEPEMPVLYGGPVSTEAGFVLHKERGEWNSSLEVDEGLCVTSSRDILDAIAQGKGPKKLFGFIGLCRLVGRAA